MVLLVSSCGRRPLFPPAAATCWCHQSLVTFPAACRHVVELSQPGSRALPRGSGQRRAHDQPSPQHHGPAAVLGRRPVRLLPGASCRRPGVCVALCSPRREVLPELHGEASTSSSNSRPSKEQHSHILTSHHLQEVDCDCTRPLNLKCPVWCWQVFTGVHRCSLGFSFSVADKISFP